MRDWVTDTFGIDAAELERIAEQARDAVESNAGGLTGGFTAVAGTAGEVLSGVALALFLTFFFLAEV